MDAMILTTRKQVPAPAVKRLPVTLVMTSRVLAALTAEAGPNFGVSKQGLPHPRGSPLRDGGQLLVVQGLGPRLDIKAGSVVHIGVPHRLEHERCGLPERGARILCTGSRGRQEAHCGPRRPPVLAGRGAPLSF